MASTPQTRRRSLDLRGRVEPCRTSPELAIPKSPRASPPTRLAYRMQTSVPELDRPLERAAVHTRDVRHRARQADLRQQLPARPPAGGARRTLRAAVSTAAGTPTAPVTMRHRQQTRLALPRDGPRRRGSDQGSEAARPSRQHARDLGRGVRPHAHERGPQRLKIPRPRPPPARLHHVAGGRRHQARRHSTGRPTTSATTSSKTPFPSTTCTPPSCTCWVSTTRG